jgi:hypothetical protein
VCAAAAALEDAMPLLIGYLVALSVFLGGGYAGVKWLAYPDPSPPVARIAGKSTPAKPSVAKTEELAQVPEPQKQPESVAEATVVPEVPDTIVSAAPPVAAESASSQTVTPAAIVEPVQPVAEANASVAAVQDKTTAPEAPASDIASVEPPKPSPLPAGPVVDPSEAREARAEVGNGIAPDTAKAAEAHATIETAQPQSAGEASTASGRDVGRSAPKQKSAQARQKTRSSARVPSSSARKPVMMVMRTIEFADGHRETRLLPLPRYGRASAFASDLGFFGED